MSLIDIDLFPISISTCVVISLKELSLFHPGYPIDGHRVVYNSFYYPFYGRGVTSK